MDTIELLGTALGLGALAGINLYLTVFVAGLAIQQQWVILDTQYQNLAVLGHPAIIAIAGVLYALQFFADKIPWVDSLWDLLHSVIRPVGGAFLAVKALGSVNPVFDVSIALLAGGIALSTHSLKAGVHLLANSSPEPFSNIALSVTEDATVLGGLFLLYTHPVVLLALVVVVVFAILYFGPKMARAVKVKGWLAWRKLNFPAGKTRDITVLPKNLSSDADIQLHGIKGKAEVEWAVPCICAGSKRLKPNTSGYLIALEGEQHKLVFVGRGFWRKTAQILDFVGYKVTHESKFLSENLVLYSVDRRPREVFYFERCHRNLVALLAKEMEKRLDPENGPQREPELPESSVELPEVAELRPAFPGGPLRFPNPGSPGQPGNPPRGGGEEKSA